MPLSDEERRERRRIRDANNRERVNEQKRLWRSANSAKVKAQKRASYERHRTDILARRKLLLRSDPARVDAKREADRIYRAANIDRLNARALAYASDHREQARERARKWYRNNRDRAILASTLHARANPDLVIRRNVRAELRASLGDAIPLDEFIPFIDAKVRHRLLRRALKEAAQ